MEKPNERRQFMTRTLLASAAAAASTLASGGLLSRAWASDKDQAGKDAGGPGGKDSKNPLQFHQAATLKKLGALHDRALDCLKKGTTCAAHCQDQLASGNQVFAKCASAVQQMNVLCEATARLAAMKSVRLPGVIDSCIASLEACRDACLEHKAHFAHGMHLECKECAEACDLCLEACNDFKKSAQA